MREWLKRGLVWLALAATGLCSAAPSEVRINIGRRSLVLPEAWQASGEALATEYTGGLSLKVQRVLARLTTAGGKPMLLLLESVDTAGSFEWQSSCDKLKSSPQHFVYNPVRMKQQECVQVIGDLDLVSVLKQLAPDVREPDGLLPGEPVGYAVFARYAVSGGAMLKATVLVPEPFAGALPGNGQPPADDSGLPGPVVAWARSLGTEVREGVQSFQGVWHLPPINEKE